MYPQRHDERNAFITWNFRPRRRLNPIAETREDAEGTL
jgi:hypothetical protein